MRTMRLLRLHKLMAEAGDGEGGGAGGSGGGDDLQAKIDAAVNDAVKGLKDKNQELLGKLKTQSESLKAWDGLDPNQIRDLLGKMEGDEELKLLKDGKLDEVVQRRVAKRDADWQKKLDAATAEAQGEKQKSAKFVGRVLDEQIRAAVNGKVHDKAVEDALFRARMLFTLDEDGNAVQLQDGKAVLGKDGKTAFNPAEWIESMRDSAPHWFPATGSGTGAQQNQGAGGTKTVTRSAFDEMSAGEKAATVKAGTKIID